MNDATEITVAYGDGIGPEIMDATLHVLAEAKANIRIDTIEVGEAWYKRGVSTGIPPQAWDSLRRTKVLLKSPITTPQGGGYKSLNVTMRKTLGLYANIRPCQSYSPYVKSMHGDMDLVIVRENEEDLYAGIEYRQSADAYHAVKLITQSASERIVRYAFEYARKNGRKKVTCMSKDNIMKLADGIFHQTFDRVGKEYVEIEKDHYIIDIGAARIASRPGLFDVIVTENLYGDIISDIAAEVSGSVGLAGSSNVGDDFAMFEAIHGSAPDIAGQNIANPSGLLGGAVMMLIHLGQNTVAAKIRNAWLKTIEDGIHTGDIFNKETSKEKVGTRQFAEAVVARLGQEPTHYKKADFGPDAAATGASKAGGAVQIPKFAKTLNGIDVYVGLGGLPVSALGEKIAALSGDGARLAMLSSKGLKVWPDAESSTCNTDHVRCRFIAEGTLDAAYPGALLTRLAEAGIDVLKTENLFHFDGKPGYSLSAGE